MSVNLNLHAYEKRIYSQNGEDGVLLRLLSFVSSKEPYYVEFGVGDGTQCNTRILRELGWNGLQMDSMYENVQINLQKEFITKENIVFLFSKYNVPSYINVLSVDIDFNDFYCLHEILKVYTMDIIICEYNASHLPNEDKIVPYDAQACWDETNFFGASLLSLKKLGELYNYSLVYCNSNGVNCFFLHNDIIKKHDIKVHSIDFIYRPPYYGNGSDGGHCKDEQNRKYISFEEAIKNTSV
jgi:hypothetical protein